ncbi:hypothetical protein [Streptomyces sp. NPDC005009]
MAFDIAAFRPSRFEEGKLVGNVLGEDMSAPAEPFAPYSTCKALPQPWWSLQL